MSRAVAVPSFLVGFDLGSTTGRVIDDNVKRRRGEGSHYTLEVGQDVEVVTADYIGKVGAPTYLHFRLHRFEYRERSEKSHRSEEKSHRLDSKREKEKNHRYSEKDKGKTSLSHSRKEKWASSKEGSTVASSERRGAFVSSVGKVTSRPLSEMEIPPTGLPPPTATGVPLHVEVVVVRSLPEIVVLVTKIFGERVSHPSESDASVRASLDNEANLGSSNGSVLTRVPNATAVEVSLAQAAPDTEGRTSTEHPQVTKVVPAADDRAVSAMELWLLRFSVSGGVAEGDLGDAAVRASPDNEATLGSSNGSVLTRAPNATVVEVSLGQASPDTEGRTSAEHPQETEVVLAVDDRDVSAMEFVPLELQSASTAQLTSYFGGFVLDGDDKSTHARASPGVFEPVGERASVFEEPGPLDIEDFISGWVRSLPMRKRSFLLRWIPPGRTRMVWGHWRADRFRLHLSVYWWTTDAILSNCERLMPFYKSNDAATFNDCAMHKASSSCSSSSRTFASSPRKAWRRVSTSSTKDLFSIRKYTKYTPKT
ncbi:uncharacterized protein G2W53_017660 [Senna tora]|uniref:Uncharacterized protein n=1 Tax=Senna tora TaxID=362788 RepID=A0A834TT75_9FABA|nr:uncharacterized protein G2W53_017660 [Senna tora]